MMHQIEQANAAFIAATSEEERRAALVLWLQATVEVAEASWPAPGRRGSPGTFLATALLDLQKGYVPPLFHASDIDGPRGRTKGTRAAARARAVVAAEIVEPMARSAAAANRLVAFRCGMTPSALTELRKNVGKGQQLEVASLIPLERARWEAMAASPGCEHESLYFLALTELAADRLLHQKLGQ